MTEKILVPVLGESITEATILKWLKNKGDSINADEAVVELETDKVNLEVSSPVDGTISEINFKNGDTVEVGTVLGEISSGTMPQKKINIQKDDFSKKKKSENVISLSKENNQPQIFDEQEKLEKNTKQSKTISSSKKNCRRK